ncbi:MAG: TonB-dependent receptor [Saprospiraceae bacterium]|nr:TonB-dependent receptor [Saprospiraceae bacterium]
MKKLLFSFALILCCATITLAQRTITGTVADQDGQPLIGASILVKGTTSGTVTDVDGKYSVNVPTDANTLVVSYTGFTTQEVAIGASNVIDIKLASGIGLDEVVVVGYGAQAKRDVTGSISKVKGESIANLATPSFAQQLAGRAAGVQVQNTSGILGSAPQIRVRGVNSISSGTQPLIVIDGVPAISGNVGGFTPANALADINPNDIESFEVLKDGAASAVYGSRAANGVILITTKRGKSGKAKFNYDAFYGTAKAVELFDLLEAEDFVTINNEKYTNAGSNPVANLQTRPDGSIVNTDWQDEVFRSGAQQSHAFSVTGGNDKLTYFLSLGFTDQQGIAVSNDLRRYSFRANLEQKINNWMKVGFNSGVSRQRNRGPLTGSNNLSGNTFAVMRMLPNVEVYDPNDPTGYNIDDANPRALGRGANNDVIANGIPNQRFVLDNDRRVSNSWRLLGNTYLEFNLFEGMTFRTQIGIDGSYVDDYVFNDPRHGDGFSANGAISQAFSPFLRWNWQNILNYNKTIGDNHNIGITLVQESQKERSQFFQASVTNLADRFYQENIITGTFVTPTAFGDLEENGLSSYLGRINYNFANKYYLSALIRRDALSSLPEDGRVGYFPGFSFAYRISEEGFWEGLRDVVSDLRIRGSYAETGNTSIGNYPYIGSYGSALYGTQNGIAYNNFGNDQLKWESQKKTDVGLDIGLLNNRFNISLAYWIQDNDDIILQAPTAPSLGIPGNVINKNIGRVKGQGIEVTVDAELLRLGDFRWNSSINFSTQNNEVLELVNNQDIITAYNILRVGEPIRAIYGFDYVGVNSANGNPIYQKADGTLIQANIATQTYVGYDPANPAELGAASSLSAANDRRVLGSALPTWFGGFDNNFTFKGFDFNIFFRFSGGNVIMNRTRIDLLNMTFSNNSTELMGRWVSADNPGDGQTPRVWLNRDNFINQPDFASTRWVEKGDFVKLANISLGYSLPKTLLNKASIESLRIFVQAQNLLTFSGYSGLDPETSTSFSTNAGFGEDFNGNPQQRVISAGINLGF